MTTIKVDLNDIQGDVTNDQLKISFREYVENHGVMDFMTNILSDLIPSSGNFLDNPLEYIKARMTSLLNPIKQADWDQVDQEVAYQAEAAYKPPSYHYWNQPSCSIEEHQFLQLKIQELEQQLKEKDEIIRKLTSGGQNDGQNDEPCDKFVVDLKCSLPEINKNQVKENNK